jgi:hypothetical protein
MDLPALRPTLSAMNPQTVIEESQRLLQLINAGNKVAQHDIELARQRLREAHYARRRAAEILERVNSRATLDAAPAGRDMDPPCSQLARP